MTKKMIDADAFEKLLKWINGELIYNDNKLKCETCNNQRRIGIKDALDSVLEKINELATPAPEPQESIFNANDWCWDLSLIDNDEEYSFLIERAVANIDTYICLGDTLKAWRPLPTTQKRIK